MKKYVICLVVAGGLVACGGGGSSDESKPSDVQSLPSGDNVSPITPVTVDTRLAANESISSVSSPNFSARSLQLDLSSYALRGEVVVLKVTDPTRNLVFLGQVSKYKPIQLYPYLNSQFSSLHFEVYTEHPLDRFIKGELAL